MQSSIRERLIEIGQGALIAAALLASCFERANAQTVVNYLNNNSQPTAVTASTPLPVSATVSSTFSTAATAAASPPTYTPGVQPLSQDLSGNLRTLASQNGSWFSLSTGATAINISGTVTTGGVFQTISAASASRKNCLIQNGSSETTTLYVYFGTLGAASTTNAFEISPGGSISCSAGNTVDTDAINIMASNTGHVFKGQTQ